MNPNNKYGIVILGITILSRIFIVSIAWNYGVFLVALKKTYPGSYFTELGWIAGIAQGMGALLAPSYIWIANKIGYKMTFTLGLFYCFASLLASSYVPNEHYLFLTYSIPYGIGSSIIFILGSLVTGIYFPPENKHHVTAFVTISLGFPLGFLILNPLIEFFLIHSDYDWKIVQRAYSVIIFLLMMIFSPFFTEKHAENNEETNEYTLSQDVVVFQNTPLNLSSSQTRNLTKCLWFIGLLLNSCANNSILINLNGFFTSIGLDSASMNSSFIAIGFADAVFRIILAICGRYLNDNLKACYLISAVNGFLLSILWSYKDAFFLNTLYCILFGMCPAVLMSLMYSVNIEIYGPANIHKNYTTNVMVSGFGIVFGPILSGLLLDSSESNYSMVFKLCSFFYLISVICYSLMTFILKKYSARASTIDPVLHIYDSNCYVEFDELKNNSNENYY